MLGEFGGIKEAILILIGFFVFPVSEFSFYNNIIKRLFLAKTKDENLFKDSKTMFDRQDNQHTTFVKSKDDKKLQRAESMKCRVRYDRAILLSFMQRACLFVLNFVSTSFGGLLVGKCCGYERKLTKVERLYAKGCDRIDQELNVIKIIKNLKSLRIVMKEFVDKKTLLQINHNRRNIIEIDSSDPDAGDYISSHDEHNHNKGGTPIFGNPASSIRTVESPTPRDPNDETPLGDEKIG